jgi:membrane associated rhomboid family serine protease
MAGKPDTAWTLSLIGGIFIIIGGLVVAVVGAIVGALSTLFLGGIGAVAGFIGIVGIIIGILVIYFGRRMHEDPSNHAWSILVIVFSLLSFIGAAGGFVIGAILGVVGGVLGLTWKGEQHAQQPAPAQQSTS